MPPPRSAALWITAEPPSYAAGGGGIRQAELLRRLAGRVDTDLLVVGPGTAASLLPVLRHVDELAPAPPGPPAGGLLGRRLSDLAQAVVPRHEPERVASARAVGALGAALAQRGSYAVIVVEHGGLHPLVRHRRPGERWLLTTHHVRSVSEAQAAVRLTGRRRWLAERRVSQARRYERGLAVGVDAVLAVSRPDADALPFPTRVVPNGVSLDRFRPTPLPPGPRLLFSGTFDYRPNVDGAVWFVGEVWPAVRRRLPDAELELVGRNPTAAVRALTDVPGVRGRWDVPDVVPHLRAARAAIVPLREGSGTRLKALEALAAGRPVVGTTVGLAGLGLQDGVDALVRDETAAMAEAVVAVLADGELAASLAAAGVRTARRFGWDEVFERFWEATGVDVAEP